MFQAVSPPVIRSTKLYIQRQVMSNQYCCLLLSWTRWNAVPSRPREHILYFKLPDVGNGLFDSETLSCLRTKNLCTLVILCWLSPFDSSRCYYLCIHKNSVLSFVGFTKNEILFDKFEYCTQKRPLDEYCVAKYCVTLSAVVGNMQCRDSHWRFIEGNCVISHCRFIEGKLRYIGFCESDMQFVSLYVEYLFFQ